MKALVVLVVVVAVLLGLGLLVDRAVERWAEGYVADQIADQLPERADPAGTPDVDVHGFPFLPQALEGRYGDVRISLTADQLGQRGTRADVRLLGVHLPLPAVLSGEVQEVPVDRIEGVATLSYELLADVLGGDSTLGPDGEGLRVTKTVALPGGHTLPLTATGAVSLDGDDLVIDVDRASGAGVEVPGFLVDEASELLDLRYQVPALPFGLRLSGVSLGRDGVVVRLEATDTVLAPLE